MNNLERAKLWYQKMKSLPEDDPKKILWRKKQREHDKRYFEKNKQEILLRRKEYTKDWKTKNKDKEKIRLQNHYLNMKKVNPLKKNFENYTRRSKKLGNIFPMSFEEFKVYIQQRCYYCGNESTGVDRMDNDLGYVEGNMKPCCKVCNYMKNKTSYKDFIFKCKQVAELHS